MADDTRFQHVATDPRFRMMPRRQKKEKLGKRFGKFLEDPNFKLTQFVDKRGKPVNQSATENLERFYDVSTSGSDSDHDEEVGDEAGTEHLDISQPEPSPNKNALTPTSKARNKELNKTAVDSPTLSKSAKKAKTKADPVLPNKATSPVKKSPKKLPEKVVKLPVSSHAAEDSEDDGDDESEDVEDDDDESDDEVVSNSPSGSGSTEPVLRKTLGPKAMRRIEQPDYARGEGLIPSSSEDSDSDSESEEVTIHDDHYWGEMDQEAGGIEEPTERLALCNMDWDRIKADDIFVSLNSFKPTGGIVKSVKIYPSEYGLERMKEENKDGPSDLKTAAGKTGKTPGGKPAPASKKAGSSSQNASGYEDKTKEQTERLRVYQLNRLRYFYAVIECDSVATADHIYGQCNGVEYESSSTRFDLRFIPADMTFDPELVKSETIGQHESYEPQRFVNTALNQSKQIDCTWDETDKTRLAITMRKYTEKEAETLDVKQYLAEYSESEEEDDDDDEGGVAADPYAGFEFDGPTVTDLDEEDEEAQIEAYRKLVDGGTSSGEEEGNKSLKDNVKSDQAEGDMEMEITWEPGLKESTEKVLSESAAAKTLEGATPWEAYLDKKATKSQKKQEDKKLKQEEEKAQKREEKSGMSKKEKRRQVKEDREKVEADPARKELSLLLMNGPEEEEHAGKKHFSLKGIQDAEKSKKGKGKRKKGRKVTDEGEAEGAGDDFEVDLTDPRFASFYTDPNFNVDPSAHDFKKTKDMTAAIDRKHSLKTKEADEREAGGSGQPRKKARMEPKKSVVSEGEELASLVQSVKSKAGRFKGKLGKNKKV